MTASSDSPLQTIVIGHRNPDMDSICAAIGYAELKRLSGVPNVIPARAGGTNERIDFVLGKFGVEAPLFISDLNPRVRDVMGREIVSVTAQAPVCEAVRLIEQNRMRGLPVVDEEGRCLGLLSAFKALQHLFPGDNDAEGTRRVEASLAAIVSTFGGKALLGAPDTALRQYRLVVAAMAHETYCRRVGRFPAQEIVVIVGDREEIQLAAIRGGVCAVVVTGGLPVSQGVLAEAKERGVLLVSSPTDSATTVLLARGASRVEEKVDRDYLSFTPETLLDHAREAASASSQTLFPVLEGEHLVGVLTKSDLIKAIPRQLILVDHNELSQAVPGAEKVPIVEVLDHHRIGGFSTDTPILFWNNPVGSTSSIVTMCYRQAGIPVPKPVAGLLMAGLISDTLNLTSPTTTPADAEIMKELSSITGVDPAVLASEIFSVGSPLLTMTPEQAVRTDSKEYEEGGAKFVVAQIEELSFTHFYDRQEALIKALGEQQKAGGYLFAALLVTDINTQTSILLCCGEERFLNQIDYPALGANQWELAGVVSRKKQLLPYLLNCLSSMP